MSDVFGEIFKDALKGGEALHILERDDGYLQEDSGASYFVELENWEESERLAIHRAMGPVLDVGCGAGRVGLYLKEEDIEYHGIDSSKGAIEVCKARGLMNVYEMSVEHLDFDDGYFKTIILYGNNFGLMGKPEGVVKMLENLHKVTSDDAIILAGSRDPQITDNLEHLTYHKRNINAGRPPGFVKLRMKYKDHISDWWYLLLANQKLMDELAQRAGWKLCETFGPDNYYVGLVKKM